MSTSKYIDKICIAVTVLTLVITVIFMNGSRLGITVIHSDRDDGALFTEADEAEFDFSDAVCVTLCDGASTVDGSGAYVNGDEINIVYAGAYVISGSLSDGTVNIDADGDDEIRLLFNGVDISNADGAALCISQAKKVYITLADGSENTLYSGGNAENADESGTADGVIYSRDDLSIGGSGSLSVTADGFHGIVCNDDLLITGGNITVDAAVDAFHAHDSIRIKNADITAKAGDDAFHAVNDDETSFAYIESGSITVTECYEGIEAHTVTVNGGDIDIGSSDDGINACGDGTAAINIHGGNIRILNKTGRDADGLDSNGSITVDGGHTFISLTDGGSNSAIDYGSENGGVCLIGGGTVIACGASGMAEGFSENSPQGFVMCNMQPSASDGTELTVTDADGKTLVRQTVPYSFSNVVFSTPEISVGDTVTLTAGDFTETVTVDNSASSGGNGGFGGKYNGFGGGDFNKNNGEAPQMPNGEAPQMPNGEAPQMPDGEAPQMPDGETPQMPNGEAPQMPNGEAPQMPNGETPQKPDSETLQKQNAPERERDGLQGIDKNTLILLFGSAAVLLGGILIAAVYKKK